MGLMEQKSEIETVDVDHDGLLFASVAPFVPVELKVAILVEALILLPSGYIVEYVYLGGDFGVMGDELYFFDVDDPVELEGDFLRVGAEAARLPSL